MQKSLLKYVVVLAVTVPLSVAVTFWADAALPSWAAFCLALCVDCAVGGALFAGWLGDEPAATALPQSVVAPVQIAPAKSAQSPAQSEKAPAKARPAEIAPQKIVALPRQPAKPAQSEDIVARLAALPALAGIAQGDIAAVVAAHRKGTPRSAIYRELHWASAKHSKIVKPVVEALEQSAA